MKSLTCPGITTKDEKSYRNLVRYAFANGKGANTFFCLGSTGEANCLPLTDKKTYINIAVDEVGKLRKQVKHNYGVPLELSVGITHKDINQTLELAQYAEQAGADYAVIMPVFITKRGKDFSRRIGDNLRILLSETEQIRFILYNYPDMTGGKNIKTATWKDFSRHPRIARLKDSSGDEKRARDYKKAANGYAKVDVGNEILGLKMGVEGIVAGSANILPVAWNLAVFEDKNENIIAAQVAEKLARFQKVYAKNPIGAFKYILYKLNIIDSLETFSPKFNVDKQLSKELDGLMLDPDFQTMQQLVAT